MVIHFTPDRLRRNSDRPAAITDVLVASSPETSPATYRTSDILLGTPTCSARSRHGLWALYAVGDGVVVVWPGGAMTGAPAEVAGELERLDGRGYDDIDHGAVSAIRQFLTDPSANDATAWPVARARSWSRPAVGYWLSGPTNRPGATGDHTPSSWPGAPARLPGPLVALPTSPAPDHAQPDPTPKPAPQRAA
jgi:hypothetical protein